jgi:thiol-disulfide isomerase/thioredoxin
MKKVVFLFFTFCLVTTFVFAQKKIKQPDYKKVGAPIPPFVLEKTLGGTFTNTDLKKGKPVMMMIFSPECDHCMHLVDSLKQVQSKFKNTQLVLVAEDRNKAYMKGFINKTGIASNPLFKNIGTERGNLIYYIYRMVLLPQINFYDNNYKLVKTFTGNSPADSIKMFIK